MSPIASSLAVRPPSFTFGHLVVLEVNNPMQNASASASCARLFSRRSILVWHYNVLVLAPRIISFSHLSDRERSRNAPHSTGPCAATSPVTLAVPPLLRTARHGVERTSASLECVRSCQIVAAHTTTSVATMAKARIPKGGAFNCFATLILWMHSGNKFC